MKRTCMVLALLVLFGLARSYAQDNSWNDLDIRPYDPAVDPNIDLFMANINDHMPERVRGAMFRNVLLTGLEGTDPLRPTRRGAVLTDIESFSHAYLPPHERTTPVTLRGEQELYFFYAGRGRIQCAGKEAELRDGIGVLVPPGLSFTIENTGNETLAMYIITEPIPSGFTPKKALVVKDEYAGALREQNGHWSHIGGDRLFAAEDGLAVLIGCRPVYFSPLTMSQPHSHNEGSEELWFSIRGEDTRVLLGKQMRDFKPGTVYKVPPNGTTPHANINVTGSTAKVFWMMKTAPGGPKPHSMLDSRPFDLSIDANIDMYLRNWRESPPAVSHGSLIERDVLTRCEGDPLRPTARGAVLKYTRKFAWCSLFPHLTTQPVAPAGEQELFYITGGTGTVTGGDETYDLYEGVTFLIPEGISFTMTNTGDDDLTMYHVIEPVPEGFTPRDRIVWHDENVEPFHVRTAHWVNHNRWLIRAEERLADIELLLTVTIPPGEFAQPHSHGNLIEEIWCPLTDNAYVLFDKQIRYLPPGTAYMIPPDDATPHANFNVSGKPLKFFYFARGWRKASGE